MGSITRDLMTVFLLYTWICMPSVYSSDEPSVLIGQTLFIGKHGEIDFQGTTKSYNTYKGIPYAQPPVGSLRFKKPERLRGGLPSRFRAGEYAAGCLQPSLQEAMQIFAPTKQDEDCLYLNVFVPDGTIDKDTGNAVMVYIHGGAFIVGSGELGGEYLATFGNVIVVSFNYRLGVFGFLGSEDENAPGNLGLWDQHLAIQWVHENIAAFGGDTNRVTLFGESAGAISTMFQALYPPNKGLFQRIIVQSGTPAMKLLFLYSVKDSLKDYANKVGCNKDNSKETIKCLQEKSVEELSGTVKDIDTNEDSITDINAFPYLDNDFITLDPFKLADMADINDHEAIKFFRSLGMINGVNSHEGEGLYSSVFIPIIDDPVTFMPSSAQMVSDAIPSAVSVLYQPLDAPLVKMVSALYTDWRDPESPERLREELVKLLGDLMMVIPAVQYSQLHVNSSSTDVASYVYYFRAVPSNPLTPVPDWIKGAKHGEDLGFVFHFHCLDERLPSNKWEYELSYDIMRYWTNFAKSGNPNKPVPVKIEWPQYEMSEQGYMLLDKDLSQENRKKYFYAKEADFWLNILPAVQKAIAGSVDDGPLEGSCSADGECSKP